MLVGNLGDTYVGREVLSRAELVRNDRSNARISKSRAWTVTGEHIVSSAFMSSFAMGHGTANRNFVGYFGRLLEVFAEVNTGDLRFNALERSTIFKGCIGLGIP